MAEPTSRRDFLAVAAVAVATAGYPGCGEDSASVNAEPGGDPGDFPGSPRAPSQPGSEDTASCPGPIAGLIVGPPAASVGLNQVSSQISVPGSPGLALYVGRSIEGIFALDVTCTHLGCKPNYVPAEALFLCPCHSSRFGQTGKVINGPADKPLPRYAACKGSDGLIYIDLSKKL